VILCLCKNIADVDLMAADLELRLQDFILESEMCTGCGSCTPSVKEFVRLIKRPEHSDPSAYLLSNGRKGMKKSEDKNRDGSIFLKAARLHCEAQLQEAKAKTSLYTSSPQGVADHSGVMPEILDAAEQGSRARDMLEFLKETAKK